MEYSVCLADVGIVVPFSVTYHGVAIARWKRKDVVSFLQAGDVSRIDVTACVPYKILWSGKDDV